MRRLSVLIIKAADRWEDLKQKLVFIAASEQRWAKSIVTLWKVKESNTVIKKEMTARKVALNASIHEDNKDKKMSDTLRPTKNKNVPLHGGATTLSSNHVLVDKDDLDLNAEWHAYETVLITSSHN